MSKKKLLFIINPISGGNEKSGIENQIKQYISTDFNCIINYSNAAGHATQLAKEGIKDKVDAIVAVGGDGTVNEVGKALTNTNIALGIIPSGSGNGFARHLKIPMNIKAAIENLNQFDKKLIDTGSVNGKPFLATTGTGFDSHVAHKFATFGKRGFLSYMQVSTNEFLSYQPKKYQLLLDGNELNTDAFLIVAANSGQYGNNVWIAPSASVNDGLLNIGVLQKFPATALPDILLKLLNKTIEKSKFYTKYQAKDLTITGIDNYHLDGEPMEKDTNMNIKVVPNSLFVLC
jgi:YegS/Rv2252/BmrU family lipid kinase